MKLYSIISFSIDPDAGRENVRDGFYDNFALTPTLYPTLLLAQEAALAAANEEIDLYNEGSDDPNKPTHLTPGDIEVTEAYGEKLEHPYWDLIDEGCTMQVFRVCEMEFDIKRATCIDEIGECAVEDFYVCGLSSDGQWIELTQEDQR